MTDRPIGIYLHIPFCRRKCAYCAFFAVCADGAAIGAYVGALQSEIKKWGDLLDRPVDSVYFGGGTPSLLGSRIRTLMQTVRQSFALTELCEVTVEVNPDSADPAFLDAALEAGVNRVSVGVQSGRDSELAALGRLHSVKQAKDAFDRIRAAGFSNLSADLMLGLPDSSQASLKESVDFVCGLAPTHISAYLLSVEKGTPLYDDRMRFSFPDEEEQAAQYLFVCRKLRRRGFTHYEISNFCRPGMESRHNLRYWLCEEYIGIGPAAHSFVDGRRFFYPADLAGFLQNPKTQQDGAGGDAEEYILLRLRLARGVEYDAFQNRFGLPFPDRMSAAAERLAAAGLVYFHPNGFSLTEEGMLLSNTVIAQILEGEEL